MSNLSKRHPNMIGRTVVALLILSSILFSSQAAVEDLALSNVAVSDITHRIVTITWSTTIPATSQVIYGPTPDYGLAAGAPGTTTEHNVVLRHLDPATTYHFRVVSVDSSGQVVLSEDQTFTTTDVPSVPTSFPADFRSPVDATTALPTPGIGGGVGALYHDPIIFVHGNNESARFWLGQSHAIPRLLSRLTGPEPIPGGGDVQPQNILARFIAEGYTPAELWALSYLGQDGLNNGRDFFGSSFGHSHAANTADVGAFIEAVLEYTGAEKVDIVAHSLGVTLVRNWIRQRLAEGVDVLSKLDDVVLIAGANHGVHFCGSPFVRGTEPSSLLTFRSLFVEARMRRPPGSGTIAIEWMSWDESPALRRVQRSPPSSE